MSPKIRLPKQAHYRLQLHSYDGLQCGCDYMLVGAVVQFVKGPLRPVLHWPVTTATTGYVKLSTACNAVGEVAEFFSGGMNAWTQAARILPLHVTFRVDFKTLAVQMMKINQYPSEGGLRDESVPVEGDVSDLRILSLRRERGPHDVPTMPTFLRHGEGFGASSIFRQVVGCEPWGPGAFQRHGGAS